MNYTISIDNHEHAEEVRRFIREMHEGDVSNEGLTRDISVKEPLSR